MNPQEAVDFFYALLVENFHYGHQRGEVDRAYKQVCEKLNAPVTGRGERPSEIWLPIETAPKDGSVIEVRHKPEGKIYKVRWAESKQHGADFWWVDGEVGQYDIHGTEWRPVQGGQPSIEPVSVDLEAGAKAVCRTFNLDPDQTDLMGNPEEPGQSFTWARWQEFSDAAKACAEAWSLKWK